MKLFIYPTLLEEVYDGDDDDDDGESRCSTRNKCKRGSTNSSIETENDILF